MAYKNLIITPPKIPNTDSKKESQFYRGFSTVDNPNGVSLFDYALVKQDLINQLSIKKGERVMNPNFGTIVWDLLYDPLTDTLKDEIKEDIQRIVTSDPRIVPLSVLLTEKESGILVEITLLHLNTDQSETLKFSFDAEVGLLTQ
jgi:phage baseplate assembly protein W